MEYLGLLAVAAVLLFFHWLDKGRDQEGFDTTKSLNLDNDDSVEPLTQQSQGHWNMASPPEVNETDDWSMDLSASDDE